MILKYIIINDKHGLESLAEKLNNCSEYVVDLESTGLATHSHDIQIVGIGFCWKKGEAYYIPFNGVLSSEEILSAVTPSLENDSIGKIGHNIKYDCRLLSRFGVKVAGVSFDTMVANYALYSDRLKHKLDDVTLHYLNHVKIRTKTLIPKKSKKEPTPSMLSSSIDDVGTYCCEDADYTYRVYKVLKDLLDHPDNATAKRLFYEIDMPLVPVLIKMECHGIKLDESRLEQLRKEISEKLVKLQKEINVLAGRELSLTKPADIAKCVYDELQIHLKSNTAIPLTASGKLSTNKDTLDSLAGNPLVDLILEYKEYTKLMSTYISPLPEHISQFTGLIHPFFGQCRTSTGRLSCSEPNVQQQPSRSDEGRKIREAFISRFPEGKILAVDYSQAELRILAHMGQEPVFLKAFNADADIHTAVASEVVFDKPFEQVSKQERTICKTVNFGLLYGMRAKKLALTLDISLQDATNIMSRYMKKMKGLKSFLDLSRETLYLQGYTENYFGRRRYIPKAYSEEQLDRWSAEREGANHIIQSTNADITRIAMIRVQDYIDRNNLKSLMIMQVHDELVFDVHPSEESFLLDNIISIMQGVVSFDILMKAEGRYGNNWSESH